MATYKDLKGTNVQAFTYEKTSETAYPSSFEGQVYYNSAAGQFQYIGLSTGAWSS